MVGCVSQKSFAQSTKSPAGSSVCELVLWLLVRHMQSASTLYWSKTRCHADVCHAASTPEMGSLSLDIQMQACKKVTLGSLMMAMKTCT